VAITRRDRAKPGRGDAHTGMVVVVEPGRRVTNCATREYGDDSDAATRSKQLASPTHRRRLIPPASRDTGCAVRPAMAHQRRGGGVSTETAVANSRHAPAVGAVTSRESTAKRRAKPRSERRVRLQRSALNLDCRRRGPTARLDGLAD
jgi:hypothetical protein